MQTVTTLCWTLAERWRVGTLLLDTLYRVVLTEKLALDLGLPHIPHFRINYISLKMSFLIPSLGMGCLPTLWQRRKRTTEQPESNNSVPENSWKVLPTEVLSCIPRSKDAPVGRRGWKFSLGKTWLQRESSNCNSDYLSQLLGRFLLDAASWLWRGIIRNRYLFFFGGPLKGTLTQLYLGLSLGNSTGLP